MDEFKKGMVVQLKSGGPKMTVVAINHTTKASIFCQWFSGNKRESKSFYPESLVIIKEKQEE
jgi:uncharacterized protein YodC (DUF2158 family)